MPSQRYVQGTGMIWWNETTKKEVIYKLSFEGLIEDASLGVGCHRENRTCRGGHVPGISTNCTSTRRSIAGDQHGEADKGQVVNGCKCHAKDFIP